MKYEYNITEIEYEEKENLPGAWKADDFRALLKEIDFDDYDTVAESDLLEMLVMALDDMGIEDAGEAVFSFIMGDKMSKGQIQNSIHKLEDENLWENYAEIELHSKMFEVAWMINKVFGGTYKKPICINLKMIVLGSKEALDSLSSKLDKGNFLRLLSSGMGEHFVINRLYEEQLKKDRFPDAEGIVWQLNSELKGDSIIIEAISSDFWFDDLEEVESIDVSL
ncbi:MAG: hypothetical protein NE328_02700 [Lentisphaeraceae bacterium]|nr:hypothetical protein [Lentisphaeraceae bacterium]